MEITLNKIDKTNGTLEVKLQESDYQAGVDKKLKEYAKNAQIKGFRPGKVPVGIVKKMYGVSILVDEVNHLLTHKVKDYIKENDVNIIGDPLPRREDADNIDWQTQKEFAFTYDLGLIPDHDVDPKKTKVEKYVIKVENKVIDETIDNIRKQNGKTDKVDESAEGDFISGQLKQVKGDFDGPVMIPTKQLKKEKKAFIGVKKDDKVTFDLMKAFDKDPAALSHVTGVEKDKTGDLKGSFELTVTEITRVTDAEMNQELFDKVFGPGTVKTEEEFRDKILETVMENYNREAENLLGRHIIDTMVSKTKLDISSDFVMKWLKATNENTPEEDLKKNLDLYIDDLKWSIIRGNFEKRDGVSVNNEEVVQAAKSKLLSQLNMPMVSPELEEQFNQFADNYLKENNGRNYVQEYENLLTIKVLEILKKEVSVKEKSVTVDKFNEIAKKTTR